MRRESLPCGEISHLPQRVDHHHSAQLSTITERGSGGEGDDDTHRRKQLDLKWLSSE